MQTLGNKCDRLCFDLSQQVSSGVANNVNNVEFNSSATVRHDSETVSQYEQYMRHVSYWIL